MVAVVDVSTAISRSVKVWIQDLRIGTFRWAIPVFRHVVDGC